MTYVTSQPTSDSAISRHWADSLFPSLDFETTGTDPKEARIVTASAIVVQPSGNLAHEYGCVVDPGVEIPEEASNVHGWTLERIHDHEGAVTTYAALHELVSWLRRVRELNLPVVIYNASYDWPLLFAELDRHEYPYEPELKKIPLLDPLVMDRVLDRYRRGKRKLELVAAHYRVKLDDAHDAKADSWAAAMVMRALVKNYPMLRRSSLEELQELQKTWHLEYATRMNAFFEKEKIDMKFDTDVPWPGVTR